MDRGRAPNGIGHLIILHDGAVGVTNFDVMLLHVVDINRHDHFDRYDGYRFFNIAISRYCA